MKNKSGLQKLEQITHRILIIRNQRVLLDTDLAKVYGVPVKRLNEAVKRNRERFPEDFMYQLTKQEVKNLRSQFATSSCAENNVLRSQFATLDKKSRGQHRKYLPFAFTEHGAIMAANILNSKRAVKMSVFVVRAFIKMRSLLSENRKLAEELRKLEKKLTGRLNIHETAIVDVLRKLMKLLEPPPELPEPEKPSIGFSS